MGVATKKPLYIGCVMRCPHCEGLEDKVLESRSLANGESIRRRRECLSCGYRFTSYERIEEKHLMVVKSDGRREPFDRVKLERGIQRACEKRNVSQVTIEDMINDLEDEAAMIGKSTHEIPSREIGESVLRRLYDLDSVAYIRFASVYRKFKDVGEFVREIESLGMNAGERNGE
jgi:transcriptional repressor NrdR